MDKQKEHMNFPVFYQLSPKSPLVVRPQDSHYGTCELTSTQNCLCPRAPSSTAPPDGTQGVGEDQGRGGTCPNSLASIPRPWDSPTSCSWGPWRSQTSRGSGATSSCCPQCESGWLLPLWAAGSSSCSATWLTLVLDAGHLESRRTMAQFT